MKLIKLLKDIPVKAIYGTKTVDVTGICNHSKRGSPGNLFIAKRGGVSDGNHFVPEAIAAGAVAIVTDLYDPSLKTVTQVIVEDVAGVEGYLAANYYGNPADSLFMLGVTGTKGKTTTTYLLKNLLDKIKVPAGLIGTIEYITGTHRYTASHTTPDVLTNHRLLCEMVNEGQKACVMEVSSHALDQERVACIAYDVAIYTNLTPDHLDYHKDMDDYAAAKNRLFLSLSPASSAIYNSDCPYAQTIISGTKAKKISYGLHGSADFQAINCKYTMSGTSFDLLYREKIFPCHIPLVGAHNVYNTLAALAAASLKNQALEQVIGHLPSLPSIPGRLQRVANEKELSIFVDFAHTGDSLSRVLETLRALTTGKIITLFGCGGDRDKGRRREMAKAVEKYADVAVVTSDNPRSEDPQAIINDILAAFHSKEKVITEVDRRAAIAKAISLASPGDMVLLAGKGHERTQIFANTTIEFDDAKVAEEICSLS